jgi:hypothetical protein
MLGSHNDSNIIQGSPIFDDLAQGRIVLVKFKVNNHEYTMRYYPTDKIYLDWVTFVKIKSHPVNNKDQTIATTQEPAKKDEERIFGVLRSKFRIIQNSFMLWSPKDLNTIMHACITLHNMTLEDERHIDVHEFENPNDPPISSVGDVPEIDKGFNIKIRSTTFSCKLTVWTSFSFSFTYFS